MSITIELSEWQKVSFTADERLVDVVLPQDTVTRQFIQKLEVAQKLKINEMRQGIVLETFSYVGQISIGNLQITIRPKISMFPLLRLMQYTYGLRHLDLFPTVGFDIETLTFQDLLIAQLAAEVNELLARGLQRQYMRHDEQSVSPRGRISMQQIANQGGIVQASLPCTYYLRAEDNLLNQTLLQGVRLGRRLTSDDMLYTKLQRLEHFQLADISALQLSKQSLNRTQRAMNRLTAAYLPAIKLIEILFASSGISIDGQQQTIPLSGFLFDMNLFFQNLLSQFMKEHLPEYEVQDQYELEGMMKYVDNPQRRLAPKLRPDYVLKQKGKIVAVLDAKYRDLWQETLPPNMLYQLVMYAMGQEECNSTTILYPATLPGTVDARIKVHIPLSPKGDIHVMLRPVDLLQLDKLLLHTREKNNRRERIAFAKQLFATALSASHNLDES